MIILYNQSDSPFQNQTSIEGFNKLIKSTRVSYSNNKRPILRQCFILVSDKLVQNTNIENMIEMDRPTVISNADHRLVFGDKDLNPIAWSTTNKFRSKKNIYCITLKNTINSHFQMLSSNQDYYILEYAVSRGEFSVIIAHNNIDKELEFEMIDLDTNMSTVYSVRVFNGSNEVEFNTRKELFSSVNLTKLKKFRPAHATKYILTPDKMAVVNDKRINLNDHQIMLINENNLDDIITYIKDEDIRAVTYYLQTPNSVSDSEQLVRDALKDNFRIYYEMEPSRISKVKIN